VTVLTVLFCRFFLFGEEKKAAQKREAQEV